MAKILQFPKIYYTPEDRAYFQKELLIDVTLDLSLSVFNKLDIYIDAMPDANPESIPEFCEENKRDMILIHEAIKSCLFRMHGKEHYLQQVADDTCPDIDEIQFDMPDDDLDYED